MTRETSQDQFEPTLAISDAEVAPETPSTTARSGQQPTHIVIENKANHRLPLWIVVSMSLGFLLPVCACGFFMVVGLAGLGSADLSDTTFDTATGPAIAIVRVEGTIIGTDDTNYLNGAGSGTVISELRSAEANDDVKAILLRVDSPGGTVTGSAQIHEVIESEITKPVIVSMASVAASGGYYVSAPADYIFARPDTITGSLGVILTLFNASELLDDIGVDVIAVTSGPNKSLGSAFSELTDPQREILEVSVQESYDESVRIIVTGRGLDDAKVREIADGRTYSGRQALEIGLIDELGNLQQALDKAADLGGIAGDDYRIIEYDRQPSIEDFLVGLNSQLNSSETERALETLSQVTTPVLEYRYVGFGQ